MANRSLSAIAVKRMLTRQGVDWRGLTITEERTTERDAWNGGPQETYTQVRIAGPQEAYDRAYWALFYAGLRVASYPEYSLWSKGARA